MKVKACAICLVTAPPPAAIILINTGSWLPAWHQMMFHHVLHALERSRSWTPDYRERIKMFLLSSLLFFKGVNVGRWSKYSSSKYRNDKLMPVEHDDIQCNIYFFLLLFTFFFCPMITVAEKRDFQKIQIILYGIFFCYLFPWFENNMRMWLQIFHESLFLIE